MKSLLLIGVMVTSFLSVGAQESKKMQMAGGFGGPIASVSTMNGEYTTALGGGGAMVFSNGIFIGGFGIGTSELMAVDSKSPDYDLEVEYGGFWLGYLKPLKKSLSLTGSFKTGWGQAHLVNASQHLLYYDKINMFTPEIGLSYRLNGVMAIELGLFYNICYGIDLQGYSDADFSSAGLSLMLKFGGGRF